MKGSGCRRRLHLGRSLHLQPHLQSPIQKQTPRQWQLQQRPPPLPHWRACSVCGMAEVSLAWMHNTLATYLQQPEAASHSLPAGPYQLCSD